MVCCSVVWCGVACVYMHVCVCLYCEGGGVGAEAG